MVLNNSAVLANIPCMPDMTQSSVFLRKSAWVTTVELMELKFLKRNNKLELHHLQLVPVFWPPQIVRMCCRAAAVSSQQFGKFSKHSFSSSQSRPRPSRAAAGLRSHLELEEDVFSWGIFQGFYVGGELIGEERPDWRIWNSQWRQPTRNILILKLDRVWQLICEDV